MKETIQKFFQNIKEFWGTKTKKEKIMYPTIAVVIFAVLIIAVVSMTRTTFAPLFTNLSLAEAGSVKTTLEERGVEVQLLNNGTTIAVPEEMVETLTVELAAEGLPASEGAGYAFFADNAGIGTTDNEFSVIKLDAMQTELAQLIKTIDGIQDAKVMITLPEKGIFVSSSTEEAQASIALNVEPGYTFTDNQINGLFNIVSKSVPNLPIENIGIIDQNFNSYVYNAQTTSTPSSIFAQQNEIKKEIERDIQKQVQMMLSTLMGPDKVVVSVTTSLDFTQQNSVENLVKPVDEENMQGIAISAQNISETYTGSGADVGGVVAAEDGADALGTGYYATADGNGDYERLEETINYDVNRIVNEIVKSPYEIKDIGIQLLIEPPVADDVSSLSEESIEDITKILGTIIRTSINDGNALSEVELEDKIAIHVNQFNGKVAFDTEPVPTIPLYVYIIAGILLLLIILLIAFLLRRRKNQQMEEEEELEEFLLPDLDAEPDSEPIQKRKQLEKMAKEKPDDFAKLLRTWLAEE